jgi:hypothetical protein
MEMALTVARIKEWPISAIPAGLMLEELTGSYPRAVAAHCLSVYALKPIEQDYYRLDPSRLCVFRAEVRLKLCVHAADL